MKICVLLMQIMTAHDRWQAFRGESTEAKDLIFSVKRSSFFQFKTKLDVFLANNTRDVCDFKVKGSWLHRSCVVYAGESNNIVAQVKLFSLNIQNHFPFFFSQLLLVLIHFFEWLVFKYVFPLDFEIYSFFISQV